MKTAEAIKRLKVLEPNLRKFGIVQLSLFGSQARGSARKQSDFDLAVRFGPERQIGGFAFADMEHRLAKALGGTVDVVIEPARKKRLQDEIDRDRQRVF